MHTSSDDLAQHQTQLAPTPTSNVSAEWRIRRILSRIAVAFVLLDVALLGALAGLHVRKAAFIATGEFHFVGDVRNGFRWGTAALNEGVLNVYGRVQAESDGVRSRMTLDYTPLRLTAVWLWAKWANEKYPGVTQWQDDYDFTRPMLTANTVAEAASAVFVFLLIWLWTRRMDDARRPAGEPRAFFRGCVVGLVGAMLFWFNPAVIWVSHCWPQWDVWLMPFFLAAVFLASVNAWFFAGVSLAIGAFLKGQILLAAPILILWPLFSLQLSEAFRLLAGFFLGAALIAMPWFKIYTPALGDVPSSWNRGAVIWCVLAGLVASAAFVFAIILLRRRHKPFAWIRNWITPAYAASWAIILLATIPLFNANTAWYTIGFKNGAEKYKNMIAGSGVWNIAKMQRTYQIPGYTWSDPSAPLKLPLITHKTEPVIVTYRTATFIVYGTCLLISAIGAALHSRKRWPDTRFLVAMVAPWICLFLVLTQMHGRYLMWAAGLSALLVAESLGLALLGVLVSVISTLGTLENQLIFIPNYAPDMLRSLRAVDPHVGWLTLLIAVILLFVAVLPRRYTARPRTPG